MEHMDMLGLGMTNADKVMKTPQETPSTTVHESLSFVSGPTTPELWNKRLGQLLAEQATQYDDHTAAAFPWQDVRLSYRDLYEQSNVVAKAMLGCGLQHGDRVGIMAGNCFQYISAFLGAAQIGCPYVVLNNTYSPQELINALSLTSCRMLFLAQSIGPKSLSRHFDVVEENNSNLPDLKHVIVLSPQQCLTSATREVLTYENFLSKASAVNATKLLLAKRAVQSDDVLNLQFTSGTTGSPKAAMLTHNNLVNNGRFVGAKMNLTPKDVVACPPPLFHCFGLVMGFIASVAQGSTIVFPSDQFQADLVLDAVYHEKCTALLGVPTMFTAMLEANQRKKYTINTVRTGLAAGSSVPVAIMRQLRAGFGIEGMLIAYGMTETSPVTFLTSLDDTEERKTKTVGRVLPHTAAKVIDKDGKIVPRGTPGELCTSGYALQVGYWKNKAKTDAVMKRDENGILWMHTGDECVIDRFGYCMVTGRIKDIIIRGESPPSGESSSNSASDAVQVGENIFPLEIEERLLQHPDISEASVVAIKDQRYGEVVGAFLKSAPEASRLSSDQVLRWSHEALGSHKSPRYCFWIGEPGVGDDFPKTGSGKHQKHLLRAIGDRLVAAGHPPVAAIRSKL